MQGPERVVCCSLCLCLAVAILSSVSLVYLTFIVYMPAKREMQSGLLEIPGICTTISKLETDQCKHDKQKAQGCKQSIQKLHVNIAVENKLLKNCVL